MKGLTVILFLLLAPLAHAGLTFTLSPASQNAAKGTELTFSGSLTNTSTTDKVYLNDIALSGGDADLVLQPNTFFSNVPGILLPGETYNGVVFRVLLVSGAATGDHSASITFKGGADIFANADLATSPLTVLSPAVSVVATTPTASESGPVSGLFTVSRTSSTTTELVVTFAITGTAQNGTTYTTIPTSLTIPAGSSSAPLALAPIPDNIAQGDRTAIVTISSSSSYNVGASSTATITLKDKPTDNWRFTNFGAAANDPEAADAADWDKDSITNLMEFVLNLNPKVPDVIGLPQGVIAGDYLTLTFVPNPAATDVTFVVEASTALTGWSTADVEEVTPAIPNPPGSRVFRYKNKASDTARAFLRLRVNR
jgi:hypothetical protein